MQFEFKGQTYEVDENDVIFSVDARSKLTTLTFRKPVELKPRWQVILSTRNVGDTVSKVLFESDSYTSCHDAFVLEKHRLVEQLIMTDDAYRLKISSSHATVSIAGAPVCMLFSIIDECNAVEYYLRLMKK